MFHDVKCTSPDVKRTSPGAKYTFHDAKYKMLGAAGTFSARGRNFFRQEQGLFPPASGDLFSPKRAKGHWGGGQSKV